MPEERRYELRIRMMCETGYSHTTQHTLEFDIPDAELQGRSEAAIDRYVISRYLRPWVHQYLVEPGSEQHVTMWYKKCEDIAADDDLEFAAKIIAKLFLLCSPKREVQHRLFRRWPANVDCIGSDYPFINLFEDIHTEYIENASEEFHEKVKRYIKEIQTAKGEKT